MNGSSTSTWNIVLAKQLSWRRIAGYGLLWFWMIMMFYSIVPYEGSGDVRGMLYTSLLFSLVAMVATVLFASLATRPGDSLGANRLIVAGSALALIAGTVLTMVSCRMGESGTLLLGFGSVLTGGGSAVMLLGWAEALSRGGERLALVELTAASALAFLAGFLVMLLPAVIDDVLIVCAAGASTALLLRVNHADGDIAAFARDEREGSGRQKVSRRSALLFAKVMVGVGIVGAVAGFFDVLSGYKTFVVQDVYGLWLFLFGLVACLLLCAVAVFAHRDGVFIGYRVCMMLVCLGCLLTPFVSLNVNVGTFIFGGYHGYAMVLTSICIGVATGFRMSVVRSVGLGFFALYSGELIGSLLAHGLGLLDSMQPDLALLTLVAVSLLFISHLFLFTESDLVQLGIGEVNLSTPARERLQALGGVLPGSAAAMNGPCGSAEYVGCAAVSAVADALANDALASMKAADDDREATSEPVDPSAVIAEHFGLSPRECDVLPLLLEGRTIARIQEALFISQGTVSTHIRHIYQKTGAANRQDLIDMAQRVLAGECGDGGAAGGAGAACAAGGAASGGVAAGQAAGSAGVAASGSASGSASSPRSRVRAQGAGESG